MFIFINGFWNGFVECTDGIHFGFFELMFNKLNMNVKVTHDINKADILLESHFNSSVFTYKKWKYSIFFSGENMKPYPNHIDKYTVVLGSNNNSSNRIILPLFLVYLYCKDFNTITHNSVPENNIAGIISNGQPSFRTQFITLLDKCNINVNMGGHYKNNIGRPIEGSYWENNLINFYSKHKFVLAMENSVDDYYITEKIINVLKSGVIPIYYGSPNISEFINPERIIIVNENNIIESIQMIIELSNNDELWLKKINTNIFIKTKEELLDSICSKIKLVLH